MGIVKKIRNALIKHTNGKTTGLCGIRISLEDFVQLRGKCHNTLYRFGQGFPDEPGPDGRQRKIMFRGCILIPDEDLYQGEVVLVPLPTLNNLVELELSEE